VERFELDAPVGTNVVCAMSGMFKCRRLARDGCKKKGKQRGGRSLANETIDPDGSGGGDWRGLVVEADGLVAEDGSG
jgi:hypothetical protein